MQRTLNNVAVASIGANRTLPDLFRICDGADIDTAVAARRTAIALRHMISSIEELATAIEQLGDFIDD